MLTDGPHLIWEEEVEVEGVKAVMGRSPQIGRGCRCSWSGRVGSEAEREEGAVGRWRVSGAGWAY